MADSKKYTVKLIHRLLAQNLKSLKIYNHVFSGDKETELNQILRNKIKY